MKNPGPITIMANERGQLPFPKSFLASAGFAVGDEYACWRERGKTLIVFLKDKSSPRRKIPLHALRGRIGRSTNRQSLIIQAPAKPKSLQVTLPINPQ